MGPGGPVSTSRLRHVRDIPGADAHGGRRAADVRWASLVGHSIECFDFYIYATSAVLVFPQLFFPAENPTAATLQSLATFSLAFFARPIGSLVFGHLGDRLGRKATLIATLLTMGVSTVAIGLLPTYAQIGTTAPLLLALCRLGQGLGLGGEWGGSVLLAFESAPSGRQAWWGMFPQLGTPIGFLLANGVFLLLTEWQSQDAFLAWGWRVPYLSSAVLVFLGLWMRMKVSETPAFARASAQQQRVRVPIAVVFKSHRYTIATGMLTAIATYVLFYLVTVFALSWATGALGFRRDEFLRLQLWAVAAFAATIPLSAWLSQRYGTRPIMILSTLLILIFGFFFDRLLASSDGVAVFLLTGLALMGMSFGSLGTTLAQMFPTPVRYTGASLAFNLAAVLGASVAPYVAVLLANRWGLAWVGLYLSGAAALTLVGLWLSPVRRHDC
jgi:metabolite-proton symporter